MIKLDFPWYLSQAKDTKTKNKLKEFETAFKGLKERDKLIEFKQKQKFPLRLGKYNIWINDNNVFQSLHTYLEIFKEGDHTRLEKFQNETNGVIADIGANEGHYVLKMKELLPNSKIIAIEPDPEAFKILRKNIIWNKIKNVILVRKAVSNVNKKIEFEVVKGVTQIGGFKIIGADDWIDKERIKKIVVTSTILEDLMKKLTIPAVDILKIDAEGAELDILGSSRRYLKNVRKVVVEYHTENLKSQLINFMMQNSFKLLLDENVRFGDLYFINTKALSDEYE